MRICSRKAPHIEWSLASVIQTAENFWITSASTVIFVPRQQRLVFRASLELTKLSQLEMTLVWHKRSCRKLHTVVEQVSPDMANQLGQRNTSSAILKDAYRCFCGHGCWSFKLEGRSRCPSKACGLLSKKGKRFFFSFSTVSTYTIVSGMVLPAWPLVTRSLPSEFGVSRI